MKKRLVGLREPREVVLLPILALAAVLSLGGCAKTLVATTPITASITSTSTAATATTAKPLTTTSPISVSATPTTSATPTGPYGKLVMALNTIGNERYTPRVADATHSLNVLSMMMDLMLWLEPGKLVPRIVERWETAPDGRYWNFYVRKGVKFHNGDDLTAKDIKFSIEEYLKPDSANTDLRATVASVELVDDYTVRVYTKAVDLYFAYRLAPGGQGLVTPKNYVEKNGWDYFEQHPIGSNSFKFVSRVPGDSATFEALDKHWRQVPEFKTVTVVLMPEEGTRVASLKTGMVDLIEISLDAAPALEAGGFRTAVMSQAAPQPVFHGVYLPAAAGMPTADVRVRQALSLAINRDEIRKEFFNGKAGPPNPPFLAADTPDIDLAYWKEYNSKIYRYDPGEAKRLLSEAGYANGLTFKMNTFVASGSPFLPKLGEILAGYWAQIGAKVQLVPIEFGTYTTGRRGPAREFVGVVSLFRTESGKPVTPQELGNGYSADGSTVLLKGSSMEAEATRLLAAALGEADPNKRKDLIAKVITVAIESYTAFQICTVPTMVALAPGLDVAFPSPMPPRPSMYADIAKHRPATR